MDTGERVQAFARECVLIHRLLRDGRHMTDLERRLLETSLKLVDDELTVKNNP
jgi:hypothetical protein